MNRIPLGFERTMGLGLMDLVIHSLPLPDCPTNDLRVGITSV